MYIMTKEYGVINLNHYPRIDVYPHSESYLLVVYVGQESHGAKSNDRITVAEYKEEMDANYAICSLLKAIDAGESVWDPSTVRLPSDLWCKIKEESTYDGLIKGASLSISGLHKVKVTYPAGYDLKHRSDDKATVDGKLAEALKALDPIKIEWESSSRV